MGVTRGPAPVLESASAPITLGPLTSPPPQGGGIGSFVVPTAPRATNMNTSTRFIEIDYNGDIITTAVTSMDFIGAGVIVSNVGSAVTINIPGGNGTPTGPNNSLQFNSNGSLAGNAKLVFDPSTSILSVTGNVYANYFVGDATRLANIPGGNIVGYIPNALHANIADVANTVAQAAQPNITSVGTLTSVTVSGNVVGGNLRTVGAVSAVGNVTGQYILGNGSFLTGLPATYNNSNVIGLLASFGNNIVNTTGDITGGNITGTRISATGNVIGGNITTTGLILATGNITGGNLTSTTIIGSNVYGTIHTGVTATISGNITGGNLLTTGRISTTGDITGGNVNAGASIVATAHTGATFSASGNITGGNINTSGIATVTGNITGGNLRTVGQVTATGNITGGNLVTAGLITATGNITGNYFIGNGSQLTGIAGGAASLSGNLSGNLTGNGFGADAFSFVSVTGNVTAANFIGSGAGTPTLSSATNLDLSAVSAVRVTGGGTLRLPNLSAAQIANIIASNGDMLYNTTVNKLQAYENGAWANII